MNMQVCFVNTDQLPIQTKHIAYFTTDCPENKICLYEIIEEFYPHPDTDMMKISCIRSRSIGVYNRKEVRAAPVVLLEAAQNACTNLSPPL